MMMNSSHEHSAIIFKNGEAAQSLSNPVDTSMILKKQEIRKMNFLALLGSIYSIANNLYQSKPIEEYFNIPENERYFVDLLVKNVIVQKDSVEYLVDLGISYSEKFDSLRNRYIRQYSISDIGDLSTYFGFDTLDAKNLKLEFGKVYE